MSGWAGSWGLPTGCASSPGGPWRAPSWILDKVCEAAEVSVDTRVHALTDEEVARLRTYIDANFRVEGDLRRDVSQDIKRKMEINCYQGVRHRKGLPVHGQRTHTNARTRKGPKKTVAGKKKVKK